MQSILDVLVAALPLWKFFFYSGVAVSVVWWSLVQLFNYNPGVVVAIPGTVEGLTRDTAVLVLGLFTVVYWLTMACLQVFLPEGAMNSLIIAQVIGLIVNVAGRLVSTGLREFFGRWWSGAEQNGGALKVLIGSACYWGAAQLTFLAFPELVPVAPRILQAICLLGALAFFAHGLANDRYVQRAQRKRWGHTAVGLGGMLAFAAAALQIQSYYYGI